MFRIPDSKAITIEFTASAVNVKVNVQFPITQCTRLHTTSHTHTHTTHTFTSHAHQHKQYNDFLYYPLRLLLLYNYHHIRFRLTSTTHTHTHTHTHSILLAIFPGEPELASCPLNSPSPFIPGLCLLGQA